MERVPQDSYGFVAAHEARAHLGPGVVFNGDALDRSEIDALLSFPTPSTFLALFGEEGPQAQVGSVGAGRVRGLRETDRP
jgi:hypothetical protein